MTNDNGLMVPTIHLNGTSRKSLMTALSEAHSAILNAIEAIAKTHPHGRDYYVQGPEVINIAIAQHRRRVKELHNVRSELISIMEAIDAPR